MSNFKNVEANFSISTSGYRRLSQKPAKFKFGAKILKPDFDLLDSFKQPKGARKFAASKKHITE